VRPWLASAQQTLTELVPGEPGEVRDFYVDLDNIRLVHPLVVSVRTTSRTETADGYTQTYRVHDRIPLGPFVLRISYRARLRVPATGQVIAESHQFPRVRLHTAVAFEPVDAGTRVVEHMRISAPRPLVGVTAREAVSAHTVMLAGIRRHFESG
jgi:hypothetical protein